MARALSGSHCIRLCVGRVSGAYSNGFAAVPALAHAGAHWGSWVRRRAYSSTQACAPASALIIGPALIGPAFIGSAFIALALAGCAVGPDYSREPAPVATEYKELKGWKHATPIDDADRGDWWRVYRDRDLDTLLPQVEISNQTVAASAAAYEEARAVIREAQAALFPTATAAYGVTRTRTGALAGTTGGSGVGVGLRTRYTTLYSAPISGAWDLDVWGKMRRQIESNTAAAQANAADLDNAKLAAQAQLATAYFNLRAADSLRDPRRAQSSRTRRRSRITRNEVRRRAVRVATRTPMDLAYPGCERRSPAHQCRRRARAIRARYRDVDRQAAGRTHRCAAGVVRQHSKNSGRGALDAARTAARHCRIGTHHAGTERPDRRRRCRLIFLTSALRHDRNYRSPSAAVQRRALNRLARRGCDATSVRWRSDVRHRSMPRAPSIGKASPIIANPC